MDDDVYKSLCNYYNAETPLYMTMSINQDTITIQTRFGVEMFAKKMIFTILIGNYTNPKKQNYITEITSLYLQDNSLLLGGDSPEKNLLGQQLEEIVIVGDCTRCKDEINRCDNKCKPYQGTNYSISIDSGTKNASIDCVLYKKLTPFSAYYYGLKAMGLRGFIDCKSIEFYVPKYSPNVKNFFNNYYFIFLILIVFVFFMFRFRKPRSIFMSRNS